MATTDESIKKNISINIVKYRERVGLSQKELANRLGVTPSRVSNWEQGANCPTIDILFKVCEILNVSINDIYGVYPEAVEKLTFDEIEYVKKYRELDIHGKKMVDFTLQEEWGRSVSESKLIEMKGQSDRLTVLAAHDRTDIEQTPEGTQHDLDIMNNDAYWK